MPDSVQSYQSQPSVKQNSIEDVLLSEGFLNSQQVAFVQGEAARRKQSTEDVIRQMGWVDNERITEAKSKVIGVPYTTPDKNPIAPEVLAFLPESVAKRFVAIPFSRKGNVLEVAMVDPLDLQALEFIEKKTGFSVRPYIASAESINKAISDQYSKGLQLEVGEALKEAAPPQAEQSKKEAVISGSLGQAPVARIVSTLLDYGIKIRASDIHIEPLENETRIRFRIDGILHEKLILPRKIHEALVSRIKILGNMKIDEKRLPQDARFTFKSGAEEIDLRISTMPTAYGEKVVMRLLKKSGGVPTMPELGLRGMALKKLHENILRPHGIILITGPTGSGKTTTLYSLLSKLNSTRVNILTLEDPIEYQIAGINQVQINPQAGLTFASGLRSFLRQDPNIIMVGEIRDTETSDLAIQASLTGHLVFSTLHTNNAAGALPRLLDMKAEPYLIASTVTCVVAQRVVRKICPSCKISKVAPSETIEELKKVLGNLYNFEANKNITLYQGKGCKKCNNTGYLGRIGVFEVLAVSDKISAMIMARQTSGLIEKEAVNEGMMTMKQDGYLKVLEGITTIEEVLRVAQD